MWKHKVNLVSHLHHLLLYLLPDPRHTEESGWSDFLQGDQVIRWSGGQVIR